MPKDNDIFPNAIQNYPEALNGREPLNTLLSDCFPTEKLKRNILLMVFDEGIVNDLKTVEYIDSFTFQHYQSLLVQDYGISQSLAEEAINLWAEALDVKLISTDKEKCGIETENSILKGEENTPEGTNFEQEGPYEFEKIKGGIRLAHFVGSNIAKEIIIPSMSKGEKVLEIGDLAFSGNEDIEKVIISEGIENIGKGAFSRCKSLKEITFPDSLRNIGIDCPTTYSKNILKQKEEVFDNSFRLNDGGAFAYCSALEKIIVPKNVIYLGEFSFSDCENLNEVILPDDLETIERNTFYSCHSLTSISLPNHLKRICNYAFLNCKNLKEIHFPDGLQEIGDKTFVFNNGYFFDCGFHVVFIPDSVVKIGENAFGGNYPRVRILCNSDSYAQQYARTHNIECGRVDTSTLGDKSQLFTTEDGFVCETSPLGIRIARFIGHKREIVVPGYINGKKVVEIGDCAFAKCNFIEKVVISNGIRSLGQGSFAECSNLKSVELPDSLREIDIPSPTKSSKEMRSKNSKIIASGTFYSSGLIEVTIPSNVNYIGDGCFIGCDKLRRAVFLCPIDTIESSMFSCCESLYSVSLPDTIKIIEEGAFNSCEQLKVINLPEGLKVIEDYVFDGCEQLEEIYLPESLEEIGRDVFACCFGLRKVVIPPSVKKINDEAFDEESLKLQKNLMIYCKADSCAYQYAKSHDIRVSLC